jgi:hypothetical protein
VILFTCDVCGQQLYFESTRCTHCGSPLGYLVSQRSISVLTPARGGNEGGQDTFTASDPRARGETFRRCRNTVQHDACNWMIPAQSGAEYCDSCALTEVIPDLADAESRQAWGHLEAAKRRLLFTLRSLRLPVKPKTRAPDTGLAFRFLKSAPGALVTTGHDGGVITINIAEANAAFRENERERLGEAYRTTLGHLRHEIGHYYFDRLIAGSQHLDRFRELFGDERAGYEQALSRHYETGPPQDWQQAFVSAYATMHPWEDWAETWAHYLHMVDTLETAQSYGLAVREPTAHGQAQSVEARSVDARDFEALSRHFHVLTLAMNGLNRSMGLPDAYPFAISPRVHEKLAFVHDIISARLEA